MAKNLDSWKIEKKRARNKLLAKIGLVGTAALTAGYLFLTSGAPNSEINTQNTDSQGAVVWHPDYDMPWFNNLNQIHLSGIAAGHAVNIKRFPELTQRLLEEQVITEQDIVIPQPATREDLLLVHTPEYIDSVFRLADHGGLLNGENLINQGILNFLLSSVGGTYTASQLALENGLAVNLAGGYHHAFADHEEGFCFFNDVAIAIKKLRAEGELEKAMIVDLDIHHGNGNASIFEESVEVEIFDAYFTDSSYYPKKKFPVDYKVRLVPGETGTSYLEKLERLETALDTFQPEIVFYLAGADPYEGDILGGQYAGLKLSKEDMRTRDQYLIDTVRERGIPLVVTLAGGYSEIDELVEINYSTVSHSMDSE